MLMRSETVHNPHRGVAAWSEFRKCDAGAISATPPNCSSPLASRVQDSRTPRSRWGRPAGRSSEVAGSTSVHTEQGPQACATARPMQRKTFPLNGGSVYITFVQSTTFSVYIIIVSAFVPLCIIPTLPQSSLGCSSISYPSFHVSKCQFKSL